MKEKLHHLPEVEEDELSPKEREQLHASLDRGLAQIEAGQTIPAEEVLASLQSHRGGSDRTMPGASGSKT